MLHARHTARRRDLLHHSPLSSPCLHCIPCDKMDFLGCLVLSLRWTGVTDHDRPCSTTPLPRTNHPYPSVSSPPTPPILQQHQQLPILTLSSFIASHHLMSMRRFPVAHGRLNPPARLATTGSNTDSLNTVICLSTISSPSLDTSFSQSAHPYPI